MKNNGTQTGPLCLLIAFKDLLTKTTPYTCVYRNELHFKTSVEPNEQLAVYNEYF